MSTAEPVSERAKFEKWLMDVHMLDSNWNEQRNCFDDFPAHLAFKAWQAAALSHVQAPADQREASIRECIAIVEHTNGIDRVLNRLHALLTSPAPTEAMVERGAVERVHKALMDPRTPRQSIGEMVAAILEPKS